MLYVISTRRMVDMVEDAAYPGMEIADANPMPFPGFDRPILDRCQLLAVMRERRYAAWRTALASVVGIHLITDIRNSRYVGKADGAKSIRLRWNAANGYGGNVELCGIDPANFRYSVLRVFDPAIPMRVIDEVESHFKIALDARRLGLNRN